VRGFRLFGRLGKGSPRPTLGNSEP